MSQYDEKLKQLYNKFDNGYEFEDFLKIYFEKLGLKNVEITQRSHDGGIDLIGFYEGIDSITKLDQKKYIIQAKRYLPNSTVGVSVIRELKGSLKLGEIGIVVTTGKFTSLAIAESANNLLHPVILIDGKKLLNSYNFDFDEDIEYLDVNYDLFGNSEITSSITSYELANGLLYLPAEILKYIPENMEYVKVLINENDELLQYDSNQNAFINIEKIFEKYKIVDDYSAHISTIITWKYCNGMIWMNIKL